MNDAIETVASSLAQGWRERGPWGEFVVVCWVGATVLALLAWVGERSVRSERTRLGFWRVALVLAGVLALAEFAGLGRLPSVPSANAPVAPASPLSAAEGGAVPGASRGVPAIWLVLVWAGVSGVLGLRLVVRAILLRRYAARLWPVESDELHQRIEAVARVVGCRPRFRVVVAPGLHSPLVFGIWRPVLVLPADFAAVFTPLQQEAVLAHELGHVAHRDSCWQSFSQWLTVVLWWNPAVWFLRVRHAEAGEVAADAQARHLPDGALLLAESLVALGYRFATGRVAGALSATGRLRSRLGRRVRRLLAPAPPPSQRAQPARGLAAQLAAAVLATVAVTGTTHAVRPGESVASPGRPSPFAVAWNACCGDDRGRADVVSVAAVVLEPRNRPGPAPVPDPRQWSESDIFDRLHLTAHQRREIEAALTERHAATRAMMAARSGHVERGIAINRSWHAALGRVLTPEQYRRYCDYWERPGRVRIAGAVPRVP